MIPLIRALAAIILGHTLPPGPIPQPVRDYIRSLLQDDDGDGWLVGHDCDDQNADLNRDDADGDGVTSCDGDINDADPGIALCAFPTEVIDENGNVTVVDLPNELVVYLASTTPSGVFVKDDRLSIIHVDFVAMHTECPTIKVAEIAFEVYATDLAQTGWIENSLTANEALAVNQDTGAVVMGPMINWDPQDLMFWDAFFLAGGTFLTLSLEVDTLSASSSWDDEIVASLKENSVIVEFDGVEYQLANAPVDGRRISF